ncbi:hypothetical protein FZC83_02440 [Rossellomorea marisflavi]|uniref:Uncharacterized protein n=1 Tax=Rossellomorea marisflavi TaxID=189381 RepID=A0A5D4RYI8_9BACI|nr:phage tail spike protein [Rossellomorea marisflavi]TYS56453.1 hypothetical protein FZC83_02440 [Rossellomorea marisflavi]
MYYVNRSKKPKALRLFLTSNDRKRTVLDELHHITPPKSVGNFGKINELSFSIPYFTEIRHKLVPNPNLKKIREKLLIKAVSEKEVEYFLINKIRKSSTEIDVMDIECYGLGYQLWYKRIIDYERSSLNLLSVASETLKGTGWSVGYFNPEFNLKFRQFDVSSKRKLEFIYEIAETFEVVPIFDSVNNKVHFYKKDEINKYKGFRIESSKYANSIEMEIDADQIVTRLHVRGSDNLRINNVNPTGQSFIDDFSYLIYPFEMDDEGNVLRSSNFMNDDLCKALIKYNTFISSKKEEFGELLSKKRTLQEEKTVEENRISELNIERQIILDKIEIATETGASKTDLIQERNKKNNQITIVKKSISDIDNNVSLVDMAIKKLKDSFSLHNFLSDDLLYDLETNWIHEDEWSDENKIDENDLYEAALNHLSEINKPPVNINTNIVNFFSMISEQYNWDRLKLGDIVRVKNNTLDIDIKTTVTKISIDYDTDSIDIEISNSKHSNAMSVEEMAMKSFYTINKINTDYNKRKLDWKKMAYNFNIRNDRIPDKPTNPTVSLVGNSISHTNNDNGSINLTFKWGYPNHTTTEKKADNIDGFFLYLYQSNDDSKYMFGSQMSKETVIPLESSLRQYTFTGVPANSYYTLGIKAYRTVDDDIDPNGVIFSDIVSPEWFTENPYLPSPSSVITADISGRMNGVSFSVGSEPPTDPQQNDKWTDTSNEEAVEKVFDEGLQDWKPITSMSSASVSGKKINTEKVPDTIPLRDNQGKINCDISGDALTLQGKTLNDIVTKEQVGLPNGIATLDAYGKIPSSQLNSITTMRTGLYIGNGELSRIIQTDITPGLVKVIPFEKLDTSYMINSPEGGLKLSSSEMGLSLSGINGTVSSSYGKLTEKGFITGNDNNFQANKLGVTYFWEAYSY